MQNPLLPNWLQSLSYPKTKHLAQLTLFVCLLLIHARSLQAQQESIAPQLTDAELITYLQSNYSPSTPKNYDMARDSMYTFLDVDETDSVTCVYSGLRAIADGSRSPSNGAMAFNTEHTWPQSFYNNAEPMRGDIHHLFPAWSSPNQSRSNHPFAEINDNNTSSWWFWKNGGGVNSIPSQDIDEYSEYYNSQFEPREDHKGNVARAVFYFWAIYQQNADVVNDESDNEAFFNSMKETLYDWHYLDPVDANELARSVGTEAIQGNKNPFIHDSSLVRRAFFSSDSSSAQVAERTLEPYISEVFEGNGGSVKYIELFNPDSVSVNLSSEGWALWRISNGNTSHASIPLTGTIKGKSFFVIGNNDEVNGVQAVFGDGVVDQHSAAINHNGNDKYLLVKYASTAPDTIDSFGIDLIGDSGSFTADQVAYRVASALPNNGPIGQNSQATSGDTLSSGNWLVFDVQSSNQNAKFVGSPGYNKGPESELNPQAMIHGSAGWRLLSIPGNQATLAELSDDVAIQGVGDGNNANIFSFDASGAYEVPSSLNEILENGTGLAVYFYDNNLNGSSELPIVLDTELEEPNANVSVALNTTIVNDGMYYTLVGNPFQSNYDLSFLESTGDIQNYVHVLNNGLYSAVSLGTQVVMPWQGFWVASAEADAASEITFSTSGKTNSESAVWGFEKSLANQDMIQIGIRNHLMEDQGCVIALNSESELGKDRFDASKKAPARSDFTIIGCELDQEKYAVVSVPEFTNASEYQLPISSTFEEITHELYWEIDADLLQDFDVYLLDANSNHQTALNATGSISFNLAKSDSNRFSVAFSQKQLTNQHIEEEKPVNFLLVQNYPNPFNPTTKINYTIPASGRVQISVYTLIGQRVAILIDEWQNVGSHAVSFNASGLSSGMYVYRIEFGGEVITKKMTLQK